MTQQTTNETTERAAFEKAMNDKRFFPRELDFTMTKSPSGRDEYANGHLESCWVGWKARAALPSTSGEAVDPLDWPLPCDVKVGAGTNKKGTTLRALVTRMKVLHRMAMNGLNAPAAPAVPVSDTGAVELSLEDVIGLLEYELIIESGAQFLRSGSSMSFDLDELTALVNHALATHAAPASPAPTADRAADARDAARWRALLGSARIRIIGTAGIREPEDGYAHFGMEIWTIYGASLNAEQTQQMQEGNVYAREVLTKYADIAMAAQGIAVPIISAARFSEDECEEYENGALHRYQFDSDEDYVRALAATISAMSTNTGEGEG